MLNDILKDLSTFFSHPLVITLMSVLFGGYLLDKINYRKEQRDSHKMAALKLVELIADTINNDLSWLYWQIRLLSPKIVDEFNKASINAYNQRFKIKIKSEVYLNSNSILSEYNEIIKEIRLIKHKIESLTDNKNINDDINNRIKFLKNKWDITEKYNIEELESPYNLFYSWAQVIYKKSEKFLTALLHQANNVT